MADHAVEVYLAGQIDVGVSTNVVAARQNCQAKLGLLSVSATRGVTPATWCIEK